MKTWNKFLRYLSEHSVALIYGLASVYNNQAPLESVRPEIARS